MQENDIEKIFDKIAEVSVRSLLYEASSYPKPGLVTPLSSGPHANYMDFFSFIDSSVFLYKYFRNLARVGFEEKNPEKCFEIARNLGKKAEIGMVRLVNANTQKGLIFLLGIGSLATSFCLSNGISFDKISETIKKMTYMNLESEFGEILIKARNGENLTAGEKLFVKFGLKGIRGEAQSGLKTVFQESLPYYQGLETKNKNEKLVNTLLFLMTIVDDTTSFYYHDDISIIEYIKKRAEKALKLGGASTKSGLEELEKMSKDFTEKGIRTGGSADLLAVTCFFDLVWSEIYKNDVI